MLEDCSLQELFGAVVYDASMNPTVEGVIRTAFDCALATAVPDVARFRSVMRATGAVLSGSRALALVDRAATFAPGDWDFYVPQQHFPQFCEFLKHELGGRVTWSFHGTDAYLGMSSKSDGFAEDLHTGIHQYCRIETVHASFDVICSVSTGLFPIPLFHSTLVMNLFTADTLCIAYPEATFARTGLITSTGANGKDKGAFAKYGDRGYSFVASAAEFWGTIRDEDGCVPNGYCPMATRFFGDRHCAMFAFGEDDPGTGRQSPLTDNVFWSLGGVGCGVGFCQGRHLHSIHHVRLA